MAVKGLAASVQQAHVLEGGAISALKRIKESKQSF